MIQERILELVKYGLTTGLVNPEDKYIQSIVCWSFLQWMTLRMKHLQR